MIRNAICLWGAVFLLSCTTKSKEPTGILKPDKMQAVLWDVLRAQAFTVEFIKKDTTKNDVEENLKLQQEIFAIHRISKEEFYRSFEYYKTNSGPMKAIMDTIMNRADRIKDTKTAPLVAQ
jgi:hypothetical protein